MNSRAWAFAAICGVVVAVLGAFVLGDASRYRTMRSPAPAMAVAAASDLPDGPRIVFRHTGQDNSYGHVAMVALEAPDGPRAFAPIACDRVAAIDGEAACLRTRRGVVTRYELVLLDADWKPVRTLPQPGIPSRTRLSPDGSLVATTTFVSGHSYLQTGFSTSTEIRSTSGAAVGDLESFTLTLDGHEVSPVDRNLWGVTFLDDTTFYATAATRGTTYLVRGDIADRTLTSVRRNAECPALSPDGSRIAYKVDAAGAGTHWSIAVLDLATGREQVLDRETANVDDQVEWLDDETLLYGLPRADTPGTTDVWAIDAVADGVPHLLIPQAWSPSVVRPTDTRPSREDS